MGSVAYSDITWEAPHVITGNLPDFNSEGTLKLALNGGGDSIDIDTGDEVISFVSSDALGDVATNIDPQNRGGDQDYETLLSSFTWATENVEYTLSGLTVGNEYVVQVWIADTRNNTSNRQKTIDSGAGTDSITLDSGLPSEYGIGRFTATSTSEVVRFVGVGGATHPQFNALMLRDLGVSLPEITQFEASAGSVTSSSGVNVAAGTGVTLSWNTEDADSASIDEGVGSVALNGSVVVSPVTTTTYTFTATNGNGTSSESVTVYVGDAAQDLVINEILASNDNGLKDLDGDRNDWIELYNPNPYPVDAGNYRITDDPSLALSWDIPANSMIAANGYLVIFASGKDLATNVDDLHTDFKLSSAGEYLALLNDTGDTVVDQLPDDYPLTTVYPAMGVDISYGVYGSGEYRFFSTPTPGEENGVNGYNGFVSDTKFSHDRGFYDDPIMLEITSETPSAVIRYTTDGSIPTETNGNFYSGAILVDETTVVRAYASFPDYEPTNVDTHTYLFASDIIAAANMDTAVTEDGTYGPQMVDSLKALPVISLNIEDVANLDNSTEKQTSIEWINADGTKGFQHDAGITRFGGYFTDFDKKSFRVYFRKDYGVGKLNYPLFDGFENGRAPTDTFDHLDLRSGSHDMSMRGAYLSNRFTDDTMLEMGHVAPHGRFVHLIRNGVYWGQYHLRERWSASFGEEYLGGDKDNYDAINGNQNLGGWAIGSASDGTIDGWNHIKSLAAGANPYVNLKARVDLANYIDFMLLYNSGRCENEYRALMQPVDNGVTMKMYLNDADGFFRSGSNNNAVGPGDVFEALLNEAHPDFMTLLADRIQLHYFGNGAYTPGKTIARLQRRYDETQLSFLSESARWGERTPNSYNSWQENLIDNTLPGKTADKVADFKSYGWYPDLSAPSYNQNGGVVPYGFSLLFGSEDAGVVYYTLDGSDPRLPGGGINSNAIAVNITAGNTTPMIVEGSGWKYLDNGSNQGTAWRANGFNDSGWASGNAELGYGDGDEVTTVSYGADDSNKYITTYFRKSFTVSDVSLFTGLSLTLKRDDGAVVYINGVEVVRSNMTTGTIGYTTLAESAIGGDGESTFLQFDIPTSVLQNGSNTVAVEIHQAMLTSSDISFDLTLTGIGDSIPAQISLIGDANVNARLLSGGEWSAMNTEDFVISATPVEPLVGDLVVSEIHYHASNPTAGELAAQPGVADSDFEFLELMNLTGEPLKLDGAALTEGVGYLFPEDSIIQPGDRVVIVANAEAFALRHPDVDVFGVFTGGLKNSTETITLVSATGTTLLSFDYSDGTDRGGVEDTLWAISPDGEGPSLVLIDPRVGVDLGDPLEWRASLDDDGNPGDENATLQPLDPEADDDGDGYSVLTELTLGSSDADGNNTPEVSVSVIPYAELGGDSYLTIIFTRDTKIISSVSVEGSDDMLDWASEGVFVESVSLGNGVETFQYRHPVSTGAAVSRQFLRVKVTE